MDNSRLSNLCQCKMRSTHPKTYVWRSPKSAETALISLSRRSRRSPLDEDEEDPPPPPPGVGVIRKSDSSNWSTRRVGVSGSVQFVIVVPPECRLMADVMSRLLTGGGGVDGISSTTTISGTSIVNTRLSSRKRRYMDVNVRTMLSNGGLSSFLPLSQETPSFCDPVQ